jgi:hypothetical protein
MANASHLDEERWDLGPIGVRRFGREYPPVGVGSILQLAGPLESLGSFWAER